VSAPLPAERLERRLPDAKPTYSRGEAIAEATRCLYCHDAPCIAACPTGIDIPGFIRKIATDNVRGSARTILSANLLGYSCARVCPVEVLCVGACVYNDWHRTPPIQIGRLQRFAVEMLFSGDQAQGLLSAAPANDKKVACVGAGPASLAASGYLALEGVQVTLLERRRLSGGLNSTGVAPYKMHAEASLLEVDYIRSLGVTVREGVEVGKDVDVAQLLKDYDAIFLGPGLGGDATLGIPGEDGPGVIGATAWIERLKLDPKFELDGTRRALVIGGGNTSIDAARELAQLGVAEVSLVYRRTAADMPGYRHELEAALREGVRFVERAVPRAFVHDGAKLRALELDDGRKLQADLVIVGIGQSKLRDLVARFPGVAVDDRGRAIVDSATGRTGNPKVFAGGDVLGGELVVTAVQEAKRAARAICAQLGVIARKDSPMMAGHE
jgi:glutamate synthase (NADPH/NADH) small chain